MKCIFQIFATCATFYLPLLVILFLYWRIFQAARKRIRKRPGTIVQPPRERRGILRLVTRRLRHFTALNRYTLRDSLAARLKSLSVIHNFHEGDFCALQTNYVAELLNVAPSGATDSLCCLSSTPFLNCSAMFPFRHSARLQSPSFLHFAASVTVAKAWMIKAASSPRTDVIFPRMTGTLSPF